MSPSVLRYITKQSSQRQQRMSEDDFLKDMGRQRLEAWSDPKDAVVKDVTTPSGREAFSKCGDPLRNKSNLCKQNVLQTRPQRCIQWRTMPHTTDKEWLTPCLEQCTFQPGNTHMFYNISAIVIGHRYMYLNVLNCEEVNWRTPTTRVPTHW